MVDITSFMEKENEGEWEKTDKGWSHITQQVKWEDIFQWQVDMFLYSCYLYYVLDKPKLPDSDFDSIVRLLEDHYDELPERIKILCPERKIKPVAYMVPSIMTSEEIFEAMEWGKV